MNDTFAEMIVANPARLTMLNLSFRFGALLLSCPTLQDETDSSFTFRSWPSLSEIRGSR